MNAKALHITFHVFQEIRCWRIKLILKLIYFIMTCIRVSVKFSLH